MISLITLKPGQWTIWFKNEQKDSYPESETGYEIRTKYDIYSKLAKELYPKDFIDQDIFTLEYEMIYYKHDVMHKPQFKISTFVALF